MGLKNNNHFIVKFAITGCGSNITSLYTQKLDVLGDAHALVYETYLKELLSPLKIAEVRE